MLSLKLTWPTELMGSIMPPSKLKLLNVSVGFMLGSMFSRIASEMAPMRYGEMASPKRCEKRICVALAKLRRGGMTM